MSLLLLTFCELCYFALAAKITQFDVLVYGANAGGCLSAVAASQSGAKTVLLCNTWPDCFAEGGLRVGGLTSGGLGMTDSCHQSDGEPTDPCQLSITGGLTKMFYNRSASHYGNSPQVLKHCTDAHSCTCAFPQRCSFLNHSSSSHTHTHTHTRL